MTDSLVTQATDVAAGASRRRSLPPFALLDLVLGAAVSSNALMLGPLVAAARSGPRGTVAVGISPSPWACSPAIWNDQFLDNDHLSRMPGVVGGAAFAAWIASLETTQRAHPRAPDRPERPGGHTRRGALVADGMPMALAVIGQRLDWQLGALWRIDEQQQVLRLVDVWKAPGR